MKTFTRQAWFRFWIALCLCSSASAVKQLPDPDIFDGSLLEAVSRSAEGGQEGGGADGPDESESTLEDAGGDGATDEAEGQDEGSERSNDNPETGDLQEEGGTAGSAVASEGASDSSAQEEEDGNGPGTPPQGEAGNAGAAATGGIDFGDLPDVQDVAIGGGRQIDRPVQPERPELPPGALPEYSGRESAERTDQDGSNEAPGSSGSPVVDAPSQPVEDEEQNRGSSGVQPPRNEPVRPVGRGDSVPTDF